ncbi:MAG: hypothetical protein OEV44_09530 [Spirochaetota bacterium]|nr:hypothetical protein [Spirochaetota bacterium]
MENKNYAKLKTRLIGAINNAIAKDPNINQYMLEKAFIESCKKLIIKGKLRA